MPEVRSNDGARIHYDDEGRGEPALLCIPGWCTSRAVFHELVSRNSTRRRVLSVDLRGHGESEQGGANFDGRTVLEDLLAVVKASGARQVVPVALSHGGWWAIELRRRLGEQVPKLVLLDWIVLEPPPPFLAALSALRSDHWREAREGLFDMWLEGVDSESIIRFVQEDMGSFDQDMWARAAREISTAYAREGWPLRALSELSPPVPALHLYSQPEAPEYLDAQRDFALHHPEFQVTKLPARSHFPTLEVPDQVAAHIEAFVSSTGVRTEPVLSDAMSP